MLLVRRQYSLHQLKACIETFNQDYYSDQRSLTYTCPIEEFIKLSFDRALYFINTLYDIRHRGETTLEQNRYAHNQLKECIEEWNTYITNNQERFEYTTPPQRFLKRAADGLYYMCEMLYFDNHKQNNPSNVWLPN